MDAARRPRRVKGQSPPTLASRRLPDDMPVPRREDIAEFALLEGMCAPQVLRYSLQNGWLARVPGSSTWRSGQAIERSFGAREMGFRRALKTFPMQNRFFEPS